MQTFISALVFIVVFGSILFLAYVTTKYIGTKTGKSMKGKYINIVDSVSLGLDSKLHLIKVGEQFVLISSSGKNIQLLQTIQMDSVSALEGENVSNSSFDFRDIFDKYLQGFKGIQSKKITDKEKNNESESKSNPQKEVFKNNLVKLKTITSAISGQTLRDGDENTNEKQP